MNHTTSTPTAHTSASQLVEIASQAEVISHLDAHGKCHQCPYAGSEAPCTNADCPSVGSLIDDVEIDQIQAWLSTQTSSHPYEDDPTGAVDLAAATPEAIDQIIVKDPDPRRRSAAAANPNASPDALVEALGDENSYVRAAAAANPNMPVEALAAHSDQSRKVVAALAGHPHLPAEHLDKLADSLLAAAATHPENPTVAMIGIKVASHPHLAATTAEKMAVIKDAATRAALASRSDLDLFVSAVLAKDPSPDVQSALASKTSHPGILEHLAASPRNRVQAGAAANPNLPAHILAEKTQAGYWRVRAAAYENPAISSDLILTGLNDPDSRVHIHVYRSGHPTLADSAQLDLISSSDSRRIAASIYPGLSYDERSSIAYSGHPGQRWAVAVNTATVEPDLLGLLSEDAEVTVRLATAANPHTPKAALSKLSADPDEKVAKLAKYNLARRI